MFTSIEGFILTTRVIESQGQSCIECWFLSDQGPVKGITAAQQNVFFITQTQQNKVTELLTKQRIPHTCKALELKSFEQQAISALYFAKNQDVFNAKKLLKQAEVLCFEQDIRLTDRYLMERFVYGSGRFSGVQKQSKPSSQSAHKELTQLQVKPGQYRPKFCVLSLDIECSEKGQLYSIGLASADFKLVLMIGQQPKNAPDWIVWVEHEKALLQCFVTELTRFDPDIIIGWNLVNFDFRLLIERAAL